MPNHASTQYISIKQPSGDPKSARKSVANPRNVETITPAPETLQEFPRQEAAEDAAQRDDQRCTHHDSRDQNINPSRPAEPTRRRLQWRKKDNETKHRRGSQTSQCRMATECRCGCCGCCVVVVCLLCVVVVCLLCVVLLCCWLLNGLFILKE